MPMPDDIEPGFKTTESWRSTGAEANHDYYALLGLDERYDIDRAALEASYLARSRTVHPDRFVTAPPAQRVAALQASMQLNDAYKTLLRPLPRAEYLLVRHGVAIADNEALDPGFLMEMLELREELAEARGRGDQAVLGKLEQAMRDRQDAALGDVAATFARFEATGDASLLDAIKRRIIHLRYMARYLEEFDDGDD